ncbi:MAG TPA: hypothetical protein VGT61_06820 [Thermomicrobiales bacterium]|jgi:predicted glycosyltransferase|nr:hypothetical protein [Thermomicrobiales bacterium]
MMGTLPGSATPIQSGARVLYYCHDTFGLGHIRRTLTLAGHLHEHVPGVSQLIVTGSPVAHGFQLPHNTDCIKLPSVTKDDRGAYEPHSLSCTLAAVRDMRSDILLSAAHRFRPDYLVIDHAPGGYNGEALATLCHFKQSFPDTRLVLGLRDVIDDPAAIRRTWEKDGTSQLLDEVYDQIIVYGMASMNDISRAYGMSARAANRTRFVGYLRRQPSRDDRASVRARLPLVSDRMVVVTAGGGKDGHAVSMPPWALPGSRAAPTTPCWSAAR